MNIVKKHLTHFFVTIVCWLLLPAVLAANPLRFIALGDMPYRSSDELAFQQLIQTINGSAPAFSIFVGDTKGGGSVCSNAYLEKIQYLFNTFENALIYTPGDNEWTDCHRPSAGSFDPRERLEFIRRLYFKGKESMGKIPIPLIRQADTDSEFKEFVENVYWIQDSTLFITIHAVGSNNNFAQANEYATRNQANLAWLRHVFKVAKEQNSDQLVIALQADMFYSSDQATSSDSGLRDTIEMLNTKLFEFGKPALVIHGDSHQLIIDQPFKQKGSKRVLEQVYRLQVMGDAQIEAVEITIDKTKTNPFSFRPIAISK